LAIEDEAVCGGVTADRGFEIALRAEFLRRECLFGLRVPLRAGVGAERGGGDGTCLRPDLECAAEERPLADGSADAVPADDEDARERKENDGERELTQRLRLHRGFRGYR
jgi:hypothetical protein